uniref:Essential meiotic structure-specific endonuclease subunit 2 n=1 Tax=Oryzias latipes TaxID=8090 RepID=A0A3P9J7D6_ORYLA
MSVLRRAKTWEISESDASDDESTADHHFNVDTPSKQTARLEAEGEKVPSLTDKCQTSSSSAKQNQRHALSPPRPGASGTPSPARKRRSKEEMEADRRRAEEKKETREKQRAVRAQRKEERRHEQSRRREAVLVYLQLYKNISLVFLDDWQDVTDHVCAVTKSLAKRPFKLLTERAELPFCVDGSWASGARVERDGSGLIQVWSKQIQQLNRVSPAVASTVTKSFPSPRLLLQAYQNLGSEEERKRMLVGLLVKNGGKERRIGPDISSRIYRCFTAQNPQLVLD